MLGLLIRSASVMRFLLVPKTCFHGKIRKKFNTFRLKKNLKYDLPGSKFLEDSRLHEIGMKSDLNLILFHIASHAFKC